MPSGCLGLAALIISPRKSRQHNRNSSGVNGYTAVLRSDRIAGFQTDQATEIRSSTIKIIAPESPCYSRGDELADVFRLGLASNKTRFDKNSPGRFRLEASDVV